MFYIITFFKNIFRSPVAGSSFLILSFVLVLFLGHKDLVENKIVGHYQVEGPSPYFYALISTPEYLDSLAQRLSRLPGIKQVKVQDEAELRKKIQGLLGELSGELPDSAKTVKHGGLKIILEQDVEARSMALIREYLVRLVGKERLALSKVYSGRNEETERNEKIIGLLKNWSIPIIGALLFIFWFLSFHFFSHTLNAHAYLVGLYQRRKNIRPKVVLAGLSTLFLVAYTVSLLIGTPGIGGTAIIALIFSASVVYNFRDWSWNS